MPGAFKTSILIIVITTMILSFGACTSPNGAVPTSAPTVAAPAPTTVASTPTALAAPTTLATVLPTPRTTTPTAQASATKLKPTAAPTVTLDPARPKKVENCVTEILAFLNGPGGKAADVKSALRDKLISWGVIPVDGTYPGNDDTVAPELAMLTADFDGDGQDEIALALRGEGDAIAPPGLVLIYDRGQNGWMVAYNAEPVYVDFVSSPGLLKAEDLNGDGKVELAYTTTYCGAHTCEDTVQIIQWDQDEYQYVQLMDDLVSMSYSTIWFEQIPGRKVQDLVLRGGTMGSVGAGLQREREERYRWDGRRYRLFGVTYDQSDYLYFKVIDANRAMNNRDYDGAIELYKQALSDDSLKTWKEGQEQTERTGLRAFASFRLYICYRLKGDTTSADAVLNHLRQNYASTGYADLTELFAKAYQNKAQLTDVCEQVDAYVYKHPVLLGAINEFGYANAGYTPDDFCPLMWGMDATP